MTAVIFIIVLAALIFVHELGHFIAARACGIRVDAFKLGFGPRIFSWKKGETEYGVNWLPFGGYVRIHGEDPDKEAESGPDAGRSFVNKPRWQQAIVLAAGVLMNFAFAWLLYVAVFSIGVTATTDGFEQYADKFKDPRIMVTTTLPGSPAALAGLKDGDIIVSVNGQKLADVTAIQNAINDNGAKPASFEYIRGGAAQHADITPKAGLVEGKYAIGIALDQVANMRLPLIPAMKEGFSYTIGSIEQTVIGLYGFVAGIVGGHADFSQVSGPIGIAGIVGDAAAMGISYLLMVTAVISINLGVINLVPFPALDGGRILFVAIEGVIRRRIPAGFANITNMIGFALLMILMLAVTWKDVARLIK